MDQVLHPFQIRVMCDEVLRRTLNAAVTARAVIDACVAVGDIDTAKLVAADGLSYVKKLERHANN